MKKYRILENPSGYCKLQKRSWIGWTWLDIGMEWDRWYGEAHPYVFKSKEDAIKFINTYERYNKITYHV